MADISMWKGGTPHISFMNCEGHPVLFQPPMGYPNNRRTPPLDAHIDGAYGSGLATFAVGMPYIPDQMEWQRDNLRWFKPAVDDFIRMFVIPANHWATHIRFDVNGSDKNLAGATVALDCQRITPLFENTNDPHEETDYAWADDTFITDAATAQGKDAPIQLDVPSSNVLSLQKVTAGYIEDLYCEPIFTQHTTTSGQIIKVRHQTGGICVGLRIKSLPTKPEIHLADAINDCYLMLRAYGYECPANM